MNDAFDSSMEWLHHSPGGNYYELLGLPIDEANVERIRDVYWERFERVRQYEVGPYSEQAIALLNVLSQAFQCLTDPAAKREYDEQLRRDLALRTTVSDVSPTETLSDAPRPIMASVKPDQAPSTSPAPRAEPRRNPAIWVGGTFAGLVAVAIVAALLRSGDSDEAPAVAQAPSTAAQADEPAKADDEAPESAPSRAPVEKPDSTPSTEAPAADAKASAPEFNLDGRPPQPAAAPQQGPEVPAAPEPAPTPESPAESSSADSSPEPPPEEPKTSLLRSRSKDSSESSDAKAAPAQPSSKAKKSRSSAKDSKPVNPLTGSYTFPSRHTLDASELWADPTDLMALVKDWIKDEEPIVTLSYEENEGLIEALAGFDNKNRVDGPCLELYRNQETMRATGYRNGDRHGALRAWNEDGELVLAIAYTNGRKNGFCCVLSQQVLRLVLEYDKDHEIGVHVISGTTVARSYLNTAAIGADDQAARDLVTQLEATIKKLDDDEKMLKQRVRSLISQLNDAQRRNLAIQRNAQVGNLIEARENARRQRNYEYGMSTLRGN